MTCSKHNFLAAYLQSASNCLWLGLQCYSPWVADTQYSSAQCILLHTQVQHTEGFLLVTLLLTPTFNLQTQLLRDGWVVFAGQLSFGRWINYLQQVNCYNWSVTQSKFVFFSCLPGRNVRVSDVWLPSRRNITGVDSLPGGCRHWLVLRWVGSLDSSAPQAVSLFYQCYS